MPARKIGWLRKTEQVPAGDAEAAKFKNILVLPIEIVILIVLMLRR
jgi:hypothetical protein